MRPVRPSRALLVLTLLMFSTVFPFAGAQAPSTPSAQPLICFDRDAQVSGQCTGQVPANYPESTPVTIDVEGVAGVQMFVSARCVQGCPAPDPSATNVYWSLYRGTPIVFPRDFSNPGPNGDGGNANADQAGRYNSTWEVTANVPGAPISRQFFVWLYDAYVDANNTIRPGATHHVRAAGFTPGGEVSYRWERRDQATGRYEVIMSRPARAGTGGATTGIFPDEFRLNPSDAAHIAACGSALLDCYRIVISGAGKQPETVKVQVGLANIARSIDTTPRPAPTPGGDVARERTDRVSFQVDLYYPGGTHRTGSKLTVADLPVSPAFGERVLRVAVEEVYRANRTTLLLDEVPLRFEPETFVWRAQWTIPRNLTIESNVAFYRLRLVDQKDIYGNRVVSDILGNFTVSAVNIVPTVTQFFDQLQRTELGTLQLAVLYHDDTPFTPADAARAGNDSPLRGCFVRIPDPSPPPAPSQPQITACRPNDPLTWGRYDPISQRWNFTIRYAREETALAAYRFILVNGTNEAGTPDKDGNTIFGVRTNSFDLVAAKPDVVFSTVMRGNDASILERGNRVFVTATITYLDGSPYNHDVRVNPKSGAAQVLEGRLLRRGPAPGGAGYGPLAGDEPFNLTETDPSRGRWSGALELRDDDTSTPAGIWTFQFDIADNLTVPNVNLTAFDREVVSSTIVICPTFQPPSRAATGETLRFRFRLFYSECDGDEVPEGSLVGKVSARVQRYDAARLNTVGAPISNVLVPSFARDGSQDWGVEYTIPDDLFSGTYVFNVSGVDTFGNKLLPDSRSRPFSTFTSPVTRSVIAQPAPIVERGEAAVVVFDARQGDTATDPARSAPLIQLERFDTATLDCPAGVLEKGCWVRERLDVRVPDPTNEDHVGIFPVDVDTPVGLYRFTLQGRDASFHILTANSGNFTVSPTLVSRALNVAPPERIVKGIPFTFYIEQQPGDTIRDKIMFLEGRRFQGPPPQIVNEYGRVNVTWAVPFEAPSGNYTLRFSGSDVNGNDLLVLTPPIEALSAELEGRLLGQPTRVVERGGIARVLLAIAYPDGSFYAAQDAPRVFVRNASGIVAPTIIRREGLSFAAEWSPDKDVPVGDYFFEVSPQPTGGTGNTFPPLRSNNFKIIPGTVVRPAVDQLGESFERLTGAVYSVGFQPDDKFVKFELVYYGPAQSLIVDTTRRLPEITRSPLPHTIDVNGGKYVGRLVTDTESQTGTFRIVMTGEDGRGNRIFSESRQFIITPTRISVQFDGFPPQKAFGEGKTITLSFIAKYSIGTLMDDTLGRPSVVTLFNERPVTQRPEIEFVDGHWFFSWTGPDILPPGTYSFAIGGSDIHGNGIVSSRTNPYIVSTGTLVDSAKKVVPGPGPELALFAVAAVALLLARRRRAA